MKMHDRIRELRKKELKMSQEAFGDCLGVSRSVIKNIELNLLARPEQKLSLIKLMCREFGFNEDYILYGTEPKFAESDTFSLDEFAKSRNATDLELKILKKYFELDPEIRRQLIEHFVGEQPATVQEEITKSKIDSLQPTAEELEKMVVDQDEDEKRVV